MPKTMSWVKVTFYRFIKDKISKLTGFGDRQLSNAIYRLSKNEKITSTERGVYNAIDSDSSFIDTNDDIPQLKSDISNNDGSIRQVVYDEIKKHPNGCSKVNLRTILGFENRQLSNALHVLNKKQLITSVACGIYCKK